MKNVKMPGVQSSQCIFKYYYVFMKKISIMVLQTRARGWYILLWPDWLIDSDAVVDCWGGRFIWFTGGLLTAEAGEWNKNN